MKCESQWSAIDGNVAFKKRVNSRLTELKQSAHCVKAADLHFKEITVLGRQSLAKYPSFLHLGHVLLSSSFFVFPLDLSVEKF